jgi:hypothetical protein
LNKKQVPPDMALVDDNIAIASLEKLNSPIARMLAD